MSTEIRLGRLLAMVPWIVAQDGPRVAEICARFGCTEKQLVKDLEDVLFMCGVHPFTPGDMVAVDISGGRVWITLADYFSRPLRLTPAEGLGLLGAARAAAAVPGSEPQGPLSRALAKLAAAIGVDHEEVLEVELGDADLSILGTVEEATASRRLLDIDYYSFGRDAWDQRSVEPHHVFNSGGAWYLWAWCRKVDGWRLFRVDRMRTVEEQSEHFEPRPMPEAPQPWSGGTKGETVVLDLAPGASWAAEEYPVESVRQFKTGNRRITLRVSERPWLERLLLRLGPDATVVEGDGTTGRDAAIRLLKKYEA